MKFLMISGSGDGLGLAFRLRQEGHDVTAHILNKEAQHDYDGLLRKVAKFDQGLDDDTIVVFDSNGGGKLADRLRQRGSKVFMGSVFMDQLEHDRGTALGLMEEAGIQVPPSQTFTEWEAGRKYAETRERLAFKPSGKLGQHCMSYVASDATDMQEMLKYFESTMGEYPCEFELQDFVKGVALSTEGWFNGQDFMSPFNHTLEAKALMNDNLGPSGGCAGNVVWQVEGTNWVIDEGLRKMGPILRDYNYIGPIDLNTIVNEEGLWALEFTPRFGYDALPALMELMDEPLGQLIADLTHQAPTRMRMKLKTGFASALRVTIPPYPSEEFRAAAGIPVRGLKREDRDHSYFYNVMLNEENQLVSTDAFGIVAAFTGYGPSIEEAFAGPYEIAWRAKIPNKQIRTDLIQQFQKEYAQVTELLSKAHATDDESIAQTVQQA